MPLSITFKGLCAFVRHPKEARMQVLMPDVLNPPTGMVPHSPSVEFNMNNFRDGSAPLQVFLRKGDGGSTERTGLWTLSRRRIEILLDGVESSSDKLNIYKGDIKDIEGILPSEDNERFFAWVPSALKTFPEASQVSDNCFGDNPPRELNSRITLREGTIRTKVLYGPLGCYELYRFRKPEAGRNESDWIQAVASEVELVVDRELEFVDIVAYPFGERDASESVRLWADSGSIELVMQNMELNEIVSGCEEFGALLEELGMGRGLDSGRHDALFYSLVSPDIPLEDCPIPHFEEKICFDKKGNIKERQRERGSGAVFKHDVRRVASFTGTYGGGVTCPSPPCSPKIFAPSEKA